MGRLFTSFDIANILAFENLQEKAAFLEERKQVNEAEAAKRRREALG